MRTTTYTPDQIQCIETLSNAMLHVHHDIRREILLRNGIELSEAPGSIACYVDALQAYGVEFQRLQATFIEGLIAFCHMHPPVVTVEQIKADIIIGKFLASHRAAPLRADAPSACTPPATPDSAKSVAVQTSSATRRRPRLVIDENDDDDDSETCNAAPATQEPVRPPREHTREETPFVAYSQPLPRLQPGASDEPRATHPIESPTTCTHTDFSQYNSSISDSASVSSAANASEHDEHPRRRRRRRHQSTGDVFIVHPQETIIPKSKCVVALAPENAQIYSMFDFFSSLHSAPERCMRSAAWGHIKDEMPLTRRQIRCLTDDIGVRHSTAAKIVHDTMKGLMLDSLTMQNETVDSYFARINDSFNPRWYLQATKTDKYSESFHAGENHLRKLYNLKMVFARATFDDIKNVCVLLTDVGAQTFDTARCNVYLYHGTEEPYSYFEIARDVPLTVGLIIAARLYRSQSFSRLISKVAGRTWTYIYRNLRHIFSDVHSD